MSQRVIDKPVVLYAPGIPTALDKTGHLHVKYLDNVAIVLRNLTTAGAQTTTAECTIEASFTTEDNDWIPLDDNTLTQLPEGPPLLFNLNEIPFPYVRLSFDSLGTPGDTYDVRLMGKGYS